MRKYISNYVDFMRRRGLTERTCRGRRWILRKMYEYMEREEIFSIEREDIFRYIAYLKERQSSKDEKQKLGDRTIEFYSKAIRLYFCYLTKEEKIYLTNPVAELEISKKKNSVSL